MKKIFSILSASLAALFFSAGIVSCVDETELIETLDLGACLTPSSTLMNISTEDGRTVTLTWSNSKGATQYVVEIFEGADADAVPENVFEGTPVEGPLVVPAASEGTTTSTAVRLEAGKFYFARVKAQKLDENGNPLSEDSHWATFPYPIEPYLVMDDVETFEVAARAAESITVSWAVASDDMDGVNQVRVYPDPDDPNIAYRSYSIQGDATSLEVTGLKPSTRYTIAIHYDSANRGEVYAWTLPSYTEPNYAGDNATFLQLIADGAKEIVLTNTDITYTLYSEGADGVKTDAVIGVANNTDISVYGEGTADGTMPTVIGAFTLPNGLTSLHLEGLNLSGDGYSYSHAVIMAKDFATPNLSVSVLNCTISGYKAGFFYDNETSGGAGVTIDNVSFSNVMVSDIQGSGGNGFDLRTTGKVGTVSITESTFSNGFRTFFRIDSAPTDKITFSNNTLNNLASGDSGSNNKGLFYIGSKAKDATPIVTEFIMRNNLFLNMDEYDDYTIFFTDDNSLPTDIGNNWFYNYGAGFFEESKLSEAESIAGGGGILSADPCVDSERGTFNVTNATLISANVGDPRWYAAYVPGPTPELEVVEYGHVWNLTDTYTFYETVDASTVRGNLEFFVSSVPFNITDEGMEFSGEAVLAYNGIPTDGGLGFLVNGPGSIFASVVKSASGTENDHITVALGSADGNTTTVKGSLFVGGESQKIVFDEIAPGEERMIYLYACGPVVLSELEWSDDVNSGNTAVANPVVTADEATPGALKLSWPAVENAGKYIISFGARESEEYGEDEYIIETTSPSYTWNAFPSGSWTINVQAIPSDAEKFSNSEIVTVPVTVAAPALAPMTSGSITQEDMEFLLAVTGGKEINGDPATGIAASVSYKGFVFTGRSGKVSKFNSSENYGAFFNTGGSSDFTQDKAGRTIRFMAAGPGKLEYVVVSNGSDTRTHAVSVNYTDDTEPLGETKPQPTTMPATWDDHTYTRELATASGDVIDLYSTKSVNYISVTWTPTGGIESDPEAIEEQKDIVGYLATTYPDASDAAKVDLASETPVTIDKVTYCGKSGKPMQWDGDRIKFQGASDYDEKTVEAGGEVIPEGGYISFKVTKPGTIKHYIRSGSGSDAGRTVRIILVMNDGADIVRLDNFNAPTGSYKEGLEMTTAITEDHLSMTTSTATVYIYSLVNGVNAYYLEYIPD